MKNHPPGDDGQRPSNERTGNGPQLTKLPGGLYPYFFSGRLLEGVKEMEGMKILAIESARKAGRILQKRLGRVKKVDYKGVVNLVTEMDFLSEKIIVSEIRKQHPNHGFLAEEKAREQTVSPYRWIIDPLDGTTNYAHGYPVYGVSIALERQGEIVLGVVYDPSRDELFVAQKGKGARLNGRRIRVSSVPKLSRSLLATGFPYDVRENPINNFDHFQNFAIRVHAVRRSGSAALDLCYVAAGRFDGFWEMKLGPWDLAAGSLMVQEAGGKVTDFRGRSLGLDGSYVLASNGRIHGEMIKVLKKGRV
jgi:myo-inositol-1(or 4)-monophosphatase